LTVEPAGSEFDLPFALDIQREVEEEMEEESGIDIGVEWNEPSRTERGIHCHYNRPRVVFVMTKGITINRVNRKIACLTRWIESQHVTNFR
jgi:hypothetical protein